jgi:hypothetical protein
MSPSWMLRRVAVVRTYVSEGRDAFILRVTRIDELGTTLAVISNRSTPILVTLVMEATCCSETSVLGRTDVSEKHSC